MVFHYGNISLAIMERDMLYFTFHNGKRVLTVNNNIKPDEAKDALENIRTMESAGNRRAVPRRWFGASVAFLVGSMFALYALEDPYPYIVFPIIGIGLLIPIMREKAGAYGRDMPASDGKKWIPFVVIAVMISVFFATVFARRAYDLAWLPIVVGLIVGILILMISESERRGYLAKANEVQAE